MQEIPSSNDQPSALELLDKENSSFYESLKGLSSQMALELYRKKIEELELKLREEKLEYESARAREEFFDQAESDVYLGKLELMIEKLRLEQSSIGSHKPVPAPSVSSAPAVSSAVVSPTPSKPSLSTAKATDRKKLTLEQAADYLGVAVQTVYQWCFGKEDPPLQSWP
jgi:DNA-binding transcriptional regulator YiaG